MRREEADNRPRKSWKDNNILYKISEGRHTFKDYEGVISFEDSEERKAVIEFIKKNNQDFLNGHVDEAIPMEEEFEAENEEDAEEFSRSIVIKGATDRFLEDFTDDLIEELENTLNVSVVDYDIDYTGYEY